MTRPLEAPGRRSTVDRLRRPTLPELWIFLAIALPVLAALAAPLPTVDLTYQLRAGSEILGGRGIPSIDQWTFTAAGQPWLDQQWGAQVALAAVFDVAGWTGLAMARSALVGLSAASILVAVRAQALAMRPRSAALLALAAFVVMAPAMALRPQLPGMALFSVTLALLARRHRAPRGLWLIPVTSVVWANMHGSFILAPALMALAWLADVVQTGSASRRIFAVAVATVVATLLNPFGIDVWRYAVQLSTNRAVTAQISEWQPPSLVDPTGILFWLSVVGAALVAARFARERLSTAWPSLLALVLFAALGAIAARGVAWWPPVAVVVIAGLWASRPGAAAAPADPQSAAAAQRPSPISRGSPVNTAVAGLLVIVAIALVPAWRPVDPALGAPAGLLTAAPPGITAALRAVAVPTDRVWNPQVWGSWLEFAVPGPSYALDSRIEVIPASVWSDAAVVVAAGPEWAEILDRSRATLVITEAAPSRLASALAASGAWTPTYADADGTIWIRMERVARP